MLPAVNDLLFQHTAARRRLHPDLLNTIAFTPVSTHSRPKAAAYSQIYRQRPLHVSTHSRPKAAAPADLAAAKAWIVSTHSRPKAAARPTLGLQSAYQVSTHSRPKAAAIRDYTHGISYQTKFQHTAARRRLQPLPQPASAKAFTPLFRQAAGKGCGTSIAQPWFAFSAPLIY